jgi:hypothetical protein
VLEFTAIKIQNGKASNLSGYNRLSSIDCLHHTHFLHFLDTLLPFIQLTCNYAHPSAPLTLLPSRDLPSMLNCCIPAFQVRIFRMMRVAVIIRNLKLSAKFRRAISVSRVKNGWRVSLILFNRWIVGVRQKGNKTSEARHWDPLFRPPTNSIPSFIFLLFFPSSSICRR